MTRGTACGTLCGKTRRCALALLLLWAAVPASAQTPGGPPPTIATDVTAEEISAVLKNLKGGDEEVRIVNVGKENFGVAVLRRGALKPGATITALNHVQLTEVYYILSGSGTLVTGGEVSNVKPFPSTHVLVTTVVGPTNTAVFTKPTQTRRVKQGDVVIIPAGVYHGWSEVPDHVEYISMRPDPDRVLPAGYVNPTIKP